MTTPRNSSRVKMTVKRKRSNRSEVDRLLSDEGTRNMLVSINSIPLSKRRSSAETSRNMRNKRAEKELRRRSSDNPSGAATVNGSGGKGKDSTTVFLKRRSSLLSSLIVKEDCQLEEVNSSGNGLANNVLKGISEEKRVEAEQANQSTIVCTKTDEGVGHITIAYQTSSLTLNPAGLDELITTLETLNNDKLVKIIVLSSSGSIFCSGVDLSQMVSFDLTKRRFIAEETWRGIKKLFQTLANMKKLTIASLSGDAEGLGVTMLPLFDLVYASDKCTFRLVPELSQGLSIFGSEYLKNNKILNSMIYAGRQLTAEEGLSAGLITEILWPAKFHEELFLRIRNILRVQKSVKMIESLKKTQTQDANKLLSDLETESKLQIENWLTNKFLERYKKIYKSRVI